jgi:hypothetical protein
MRRRPSIPSTFHTVVWIAIFCGGCFPAGSADTDGGTGGVGFTGPTLELTVSGVHFGPSVPDPGAFVDLVTVRDGGGKPTQSSFRLSASIGTAGCSLAFDTFGGASAIGAFQYTVEAEQGGTTLDGTVYPTTAESVLTPDGNASCTGSDCDGAAFVLTSIDASHATGYFSGTVASDSGLGSADVVCSFWLTTRTYMP